MYSLYQKLLDDKDEKVKNVEINRVENTTQQPQTTTLFGRITNNDQTNTNNQSGSLLGSSNRDKALNGMVSSGSSAIGSFSNGGGTPWGAIAGFGKNAYNMITDKNPSEYSDVEQSTIYPIQGAAVGSQFGPWGTAAGALYGLGYSLRDDLGLKDSNFLTQVLFPIGMGDGGGMKIGGDTIFDLG